MAPLFVMFDMSLLEVSRHILDVRMLVLEPICFSWLLLRVVVRFDQRPVLWIQGYGMNLINIWSTLALLRPAYSIATILWQVLRILHDFKTIVTKKLGFLILVCKVAKMAHKSILVVKTRMQVNTSMYVWNVIQRSSETEIGAAVSTTWN